MAVKPLPNENELLLKIAEGDQFAFSMLFKHYQRYVFVIGRKVTHSQDMAAEIVQDVFLKLWAGREKLITIENFGAYLNRIVRNHSFNVMRSLAQEAKSSLKLTESYSEAEDTTNLHLDFSETAKILREAVDSLPLQQRMVYTLCHEQGLRYDDAAEQMGISSITVHAHMKQALKKIRGHFKQHAIAYPLFFMLLFK